MTIFDGEEDFSVVFVVCFGLLSFVSLLCFFRTVSILHAKNHYKHVYTVRFLFPSVCLIGFLLNLTLACRVAFKDGKLSALKHIVLMLQAFQVPILLMTIFEVCYLTHKRRSVNFCGMFFDEGRRVKILSTMFRSFMLRNLIRILALSLLLIGIVVNFHIGMKYDKDVEAGRAGWVALLHDNENIIKTKVHFSLSLLPTVVLTICSFYFTVVCWRYGTSASMVVHASWMNPWFAPFIGTVALTVGQFFRLDWYPLTSNVGFVLYIISILLLMKEVDKDMVAADDFANFLKQASISAESSPAVNNIKKGINHHTTNHGLLYTINSNSSGEKGTSPQIVSTESKTELVLGEISL